MLSVAGATAAASLVFAHIRLPRLLLGLAAGAQVGRGGRADARLVSQPIGRPGLIGVNSGAALAAGVAIVLGAQFWPELPRTGQLAADPGGLRGWAGGDDADLSAGADRRRHVALMLLAGVAVNALAPASAT